MVICGNFKKQLSGGVHRDVRLTSTVAMAATASRAHGGAASVRSGTLACARRKRVNAERPGAAAPLGLGRRSGSALFVNHGSEIIEFTKLDKFVNC